MVVSTAASTSKEGEEVFSESRSLVFKSLKVRRVIDEPGQSVVYAVFSQRLDKKEDSNNSRFKSNLCAVSCLFEPVDADVGSTNVRDVPSQVHVDKFEKAPASQ